MTRSPRFMQDAVIVMAILVVILGLWRLHSRPRSFGGLGLWAQTNIFGATTLSLLPGAGQGAAKGPPLVPLAAPGGSSNQTGAPAANPPATPALASPGIASRPSSNSARATQLVSTNLLRTNGPVTMIAVAPSDLVETPPGIAAAVNVPEAAALERRLGEVSARGGDVQISLSWHNYNDLDLHCIDPAGEEIFFGHRRSAGTGGELDIDQNANLPFNLAPVENIYWPFGGAPTGLYRIFVVYFAPHSETDATAFMVRTVVRGKTNYFSSTISYTGMRERKLICNLRYDPANPNPAQRLLFVR
jgi:hypothetical protein